MSSPEHLQEQEPLPNSIALLARRQLLFAENSILHETLVFQGPKVETQQKLRTSSACQMPCLIYLWLALCDYASSPEKEDAFLNRLEACMFDDPRASLSSEHLLIRLLIGLDGDVETESRRAHKVMRLTHVCKKLDRYSVSILHERLWRALSVPREGCGGQEDGDVGVVRAQIHTLICKG